MRRKIEFKSLKNINERDIGKVVITEGTVEAVYPIKEDRLKYYILVDSSSSLQRALYLEMNSSSRKYIVAEDNRALLLFNAPLGFYEGQRLRVMAKVSRIDSRLALKFKKLV